MAATAQPAPIAAKSVNQRSALRATAAQLIAAHAAKVGVTNITDDIISKAVNIAERLEEAIG